VSIGSWTALLSGVVGGVILLAKWSVRDLALFLGTPLRSTFTMFTAPLEGRTDPDQRPRPPHPGTLHLEPGPVPP
jgi:hypothetical protein